MTRPPLKNLISLCLSAGLLASSLPVCAATDYYLLKTGGKSIGTVRVQQFEDGSGRVTEVENRNRFTRMGEPFEQVVTSRFVERAGDGQPMRFTHEFRIADQQASYAEGEIRQGQLSLAGQQADVQDGQFYFPTGERLDEVFRAHYGDPAGTRFDYQTLHLALSPQLVNTQVTVLDDNENGTEDVVEAERPLRKFEIRNPDGQEPAIFEWRDAQGKLYRSLTADFGTELVYAGERIAQATREPLTGKARVDTVNAIDVITTTRVVSSPIDVPRETYDATYRISKFNQSGDELKYLFPQDARQSIEQYSDEAIKLRVRQFKPADASVEYPVAFDRAYLESNNYIQASDPQLASLAKKLTEKEKRAYFATEQLHRWVYENIRNKTLSLGFASARETLMRREGDCTEHALLLAAMTRAIGIPSRVAVGLTYLAGDRDDAGYFAYHMWTEAYIGSASGGQWVAFDATNPEPMVDATHIKIADSPLRNGSDLVALSQKMAPLLGELNIQVLQAVGKGASHIDLSKNESDPLLLEGGGIRQIDMKAITVQKQTQASIKNFQFDPVPAELGIDKPQGLMTKAVEALEQGKYDEAVSRIRQASAKLTDPIDHYHLGERLTSLEMYGMAYQEFEKAIEKDRQLSVPVNQWLDAYFPRVMLKEPVERQFFEAVGMERKGNYAAARAALYEVLKEAPQFASAYIHLGRMARQEGDLEGAASAYEKALLITPQNTQAYAEVGDLYLESGQYSKAMDRYRKAQGMLRLQTPSQTKLQLRDMENRYQLARATWNVKRNKNNSQAWTDMGKALVNAGRPSDGLDALHNALVVSPGNAEARAWQFRVMMDLAKWDDLNILYPKYSGALTQTAAGLRVKSDYELENRRYDQAVQTGQQAIASAPAVPEGYLHLADVYDHLMQANPKKAAYYEQQAIRILRSGVVRVKDDKPQMQYHLAKRLIEAGKTVEATPVIQDMLVADSMNPLAHQVDGLKKFYEGNWADALAAFERSLALEPANAQTLKWMGDAYREDNQISKAYEAYQAALSLRPADAALVASLASLIDSSPLSVKKPEQFAVLNLDEKAYVIQMIRRLDQYADRYQRTADTVVGVLNSAPAKKDLSYVEFVKALEAAFEKQVAELNRLYAESKQMNPPARLKGIQHAYTQTVYSYVANKHAYLDYVMKNSLLYVQGGGRSGGTSEAAGKDEAAIVNQTFARLEQSLKVLQQQFSVVEKNMNPQEWSKILVESGGIGFQDSIDRLVSLEKNNFEAMKKFNDRGKPPKEASTTATSPATP